MREIVFDTETTGLSPEEGDRVLEIACVETRDRRPTGRSWNRLINPQRLIPEEATKIHGRTDADVLDAPFFSDVVDEFLTFVGDAPMVAHNAPFDFKFINHELSLIKRPPLANKMVDTLKIAREKWPFAHNTLDALCRRFKIDTRHRVKHEALLDTNLLCSVYYFLRQEHLAFDFGDEASMDIGKSDVTRHCFVRPLTENEKSEHEAYIAKKIKSPLWSVNFNFS